MKNGAARPMGTSGDIKEVWNGCWFEAGTEKDCLPSPVPQKEAPLGKASILREIWGSGSLGFSGCLGQLRKGFGLFHCHVGQNLTIQVDARPLQAENKMAV